MTREECFLRMLGATRLFSGYEPLVLCLRLAVEDESRLIWKERNLYPAAGVHISKDILIMRQNMDTLIRYCWRKTDPKVWERIAGCPLKRQPTVGEFLDISVCYLKKTVWQEAFYFTLTAPAMTRS